MERGDYEQGIEQLQRVQKLFPLDQSIRRSLADAYLAHGDRLLRKKQYRQAGELYSRSEELYPGDPGFMKLRGFCAFQLKEYDQARYQLEQALQSAPDDVELLYLLGRVYYDSDDRYRGIELWRKALTLAPEHREVAAQLEKARREMAVEELMARGHSSRFDLTYDNGVDSSFALAVLDELETAANRVGGDLGHFPAGRVPVSIYTRADYNQVTAAPDWSGGVYDGAIRLPFGAFRELTPQMRAVLHHEYAHVVVRDLTHGNCPLWLNEGVAELFGRSQYNPPPTELQRAAHAGALLDFDKLRTGFAGDAKAVGLAYQQSWSLLDYLVRRYGWHKLNAILTVLGEGVSIEDAVARALTEYSLGLDGLIREWRESPAYGGE